MSDEREISMRKHDKTEVVSCQSVLGTHQIKGIRSKLVICHGNTLSLVISMHKAFSEKKGLKKILNWIIPFCWRRQLSVMY